MVTFLIFKVTNQSYPIEFYQLFKQKQFWWIWSNFINIVIPKHYYYGYQGPWRLQLSKYKLVRVGDLSLQPVSNGSPLLQ